MAEHEPHAESRSEPDATQHDLRLSLADELEAFGLENVTEIGRGGFGVVYRAEQTALGRQVAVKVLSANLDAENRERFLREENAMGRLSGHPNIVDILQVDTTLTGRPFIVMPFHQRGSLEALVRDHGPLGWAATLRVGVKLCGAIESAHRLGILHRDVKPGNVLLTGYGEPQLTDFGIARVPGGFETSSSMITGSPAYTAPEVLKGAEPTVASDIYGLGATLFALLTGHAAFERQSGEKVVAQFLRITTEPIPDLRKQDIPADVAAAIEAAMASDPADRPQSAAAFGAMLQEAQRAHGFVADEMALLEPDETVATPRPPAVATAGGQPPGVATRTTSQTVASTRVHTLPPTAATKFRPPTPSRAPLVRSRLLDTLRAGKSKRLIVIHAPAGFGKSTLAAQWRNELSADGVAVAWLGIDRDDNVGLWFIAHLIEAIRRVRPDIGEGLEQALEENADDAARYVLSELIDQLHNSGEPVVVVVDDWHRVSDKAARDAMDFLLDSGCHHLRLVLTSREQATRGLSRMRVQDELVEIDAGALRFTAEEAKEYLLDSNHFELTYMQVGEIYRATEGWPAAMQLIALSLRGGADPERLVAEISSGHEAIGEYLAEDVLDTLEPEIVEFLMDISVVDRVNASLATALSDADDGGALLAEVQRRDLFLHRTTEDPEWFRFQLLFAEFLRRRLDREHPGRRRTLHMKASRWFAEHQMLREAVDHAIAAADLKTAMDLIESGGMDLIETSKMSTLLGMVSKLPVQQVASRSKLLTALARANVNLQQTGAARSALGLLGNVLSRGSASDPQTQIQKAEADVLRAADLVVSDESDGVAELAAECLARPDDVAPWAASVAADVTSFARICEFDFAGARSLQRRATKYHEAVADPLGGVYGFCYAGVAAREQLDIAAADEAFDHALEFARARGGPHSHAFRLAAAMVAESKYLRGEIDSAAELIDAGHRPEPEVGPVDLLAAMFATGARIETARGETDAAAARLTAGAQFAQKHALPRLAAHVAHEQLRLGLPADLPAAELGASKGTALLTAEIVEIATIRQLLGSGEVDSAVHRAQRLTYRTSGRVRPRAHLTAQLLLGECLLAAGQTEQAQEVLRHVVATCTQVGWVQVLRDAGIEP
ncbi:protein kinase [Skermania sp. ID1734]|uniref:serine/threonine-protein kinase n=1 Tax=Skermania sp. ID1734 TaxID=2597516 RepID=UPI00117E3610|nr:serine/threonine-protein kinase [Skermania sp. ID1734]TSE00642.1 protein kinase [Skermania sp. ID1734]